MQSQMPENSEGDGKLSALLSFAIGIPITVSIISASDSLKWYSFFWLIWVVVIVVGLVLMLIWHFVSTGLSKIFNKNDNTVVYNETNQQIIHKNAINYKTKQNQVNKKRLKNSNTNNLLKELNALIGLQRVKEEVTSLINTVKINVLREEKGLKQSPLSLHLVFSGNPGTGKTTVARILGKIYKNIGVLSRGHLIETDRAGLVAGYVGQTAIQTKQIIQKARGGILFIDEAYTLTPKNVSVDFGQEAVDTLLKAMEDYREDFIVIVAGYPDLMKHFIKSNPGLQSRFNTYIHFDDYNAKELFEIFMSLCKSNNYIVDENAIDTLNSIFENIITENNENFANARSVRNFFEKCVKQQSNRLAKNDKISDNDLQTFIKEDFYL